MKYAKPAMEIEKFAFATVMAASDPDLNPGSDGDTITMTGMTGYNL